MKINLIVLVVALVFAATSCNKKNQPPTYELGQNCFGGIVIKLDATKEHGLVAALTDQVTNTQSLNWSKSKAACEAYTLGGAGWRFPVQAELELMFTQKATIGGFKLKYYWSSTLGENNSAWSKYMGTFAGTAVNWYQMSNCTLCSRAVKEF